MKTLFKLAVLLSLCTLGYAQTTQPTTQQVDASFDAIAQAGQQLAAMVPKLKAQYDAAVTPVMVPSGNVATPRTSDWLGVNDEVNDGTGICRWANVAMIGSGFYGINGSQFQYSNHGYPVGQNIQARSNLPLLGCKAGTYAVDWQGNATLKVTGNGVVWKQIDANHATLTLSTDCVTVQTPWGPAPNENSVLDVANSDPANPLDQLHILAPGYKAGQVYDDRYLALFKGVSCIRVMSSLSTNNSTETDWSTRISELAWDQTSFAVAHGYEIELAKETGCPRLWISLPSNSTPDYWQRHKL